MPGFRERRGSEIGRESLEMKAGKRKRRRKTIISFLFKSPLGLTVESQVSNSIWQHGWRGKLCLCETERTVLRLGFGVSPSFAYLVPRNWTSVGLALVIWGR